MLFFLRCAYCYLYYRLDLYQGTHVAIWYRHPNFVTHFMRTVPCFVRTYTGTEYAFPPEHVCPCPPAYTV